MSSLPIGFYQLDNLVSNHVPFALFTLELPFEKIYKGEELKHLERQLIKLEAIEKNEILSVLERREFKKDHPIIVLCQKGTQAPDVAQALEDIGYINAFFVLGGFDSLLPENR